MSLISRIFEKLFARKTATPGHVPSGDGLPVVPTSWEQQQQQSLKDFELSKGSWVADKIKTHNGLAFSWESGNDEAFVTFANSTKDDEDMFFPLEEYVVSKLEIPDAGEFSMTGQGTLYIEGDFVKAKYSSVMKVLTDFNEETQTEVYGEEYKDSDDRKLFKFK